MEWQKSVTWMFVTSIVLGFFVTTSLLVNSTADIKPSQNKFYMALWMALWMVLAELVMLPHSPIWIWVAVIAGLITVWYMTRKQLLVDDRQYLQAMVQHHSSAILTSNKILERTKNKEIRKLAQEITESQQSEINLINGILQNI